MYVIGVIKSGFFGRHFHAKNRTSNSQMKRELYNIVFLLYASSKSEMISNLLTFMGASSRSLELIESSILKSVKNNQNRGRNCDSANIGRTVEASLKQRKAIKYLKDNAYFESMPPELILAANLRVENPNSSLKELCSLSKDPITVSGLNHRLKRIVEFYENIKNRKT